MKKECRKTKSHLSMTHETALIQLHLEFTKILVTIDRDFSSMTQLHLQNSWEYWLSFIEVSQAKFSSSSFTHLFISFLDENINIETYLSIYLFIYSSVSSLSFRFTYLVAYVHACSVDFKALYIASVFYLLTLWAAEELEVDRD